MEQLILSIVKPIVEYPEDVKVKLNESEHRLTYHLSVHPNDIGKVIGKQGRVAKAIRTVVYANVGPKQKKKVYMEIDE